MATVTKFVGSNGLGGAVYYDYDDATLYMTAIRCINNGPIPVTVKITQTGNKRTYSRTCPAGETTEQTIGTSTAQRMELRVDARGRLDGVEWSIS